MKRFLSLLPVAVILAAASLLYALPAHAQQQVIYCNAATLSACNTTTNPGNGSQGDVAWLAFGKTNANLAQLYGMWPSGLGILFNTGPIPSPMTAILPSATGTWCFNWSSLAAPPSLVPCAGGGNVSTSGTISTYGIPYWATGTTIASLLPGSTGYYCLYWSSLTGAPALSSSSSCPGGTGSMTWPSAAGIPNYSGSSSWGTSYSASNTIPADFISTLNQNTTGTAANLSGTPALPNGTTATTQTTGDNTTKLATDAFVLANAASAGVSSLTCGAGLSCSGTTGAIAAAVTAAQVTYDASTESLVCATINSALLTNTYAGATWTLPAATSSGCGAGFGFDVFNYSSAPLELTSSVDIGPATALYIPPNSSCAITTDNGGAVYDLDVCPAAVPNNTVSINTATSGTSVTPNCLYAEVQVTISTGTAFTFDAPATCTPINGQRLRVVVTASSSGAPAYTWTTGSSGDYIGSTTVALPSAGGGTSLVDAFEFEYLSGLSRWALMAYSVGY